MKKATKEPLFAVLAHVTAATNLGHGQLATALGVSGKSLTRYAYGGPVPASRARDLVQRLASLSPAVDAPLVARFADALGVEPPALTPARPRDPAEPLRLALLDASEQLDLPPSVVRGVARKVVEAMIALDLDPARARELLAPAKPKRGSAA